MSYSCAFSASVSLPHVIYSGYFLRGQLCTPRNVRPPDRGAVRAAHGSKVPKDDPEATPRRKRGRPRKNPTDRKSSNPVAGGSGKRRSRGPSRGVSPTSGKTRANKEGYLQTDPAPTFRPSGMNPTRIGDLGNSRTGASCDVSKHPNGPDTPGASTGSDAGQDVEGDSDSSAHADDFRRVILSIAQDGMLGKGEPTDFLNELLPLIAEREARETADLADDQELDADTHLRMLANTVRNQDLSVHRSSGSQSGLLPFRLRNKQNDQCTKCTGSGMMVCEFCKGEGCVSTDVVGKAGSIIEFNGSSAVVPDMDGVMDTCLCPFCGGMREERCIECGGKGIVMKAPDDDGGVSDERKGRGYPGPATYCADEPAFKEANRARFIEENQDHVDIGVDGTVILRARTPGPRKSKASKQRGQRKGKEKQADGGKASAKTSGKRGRGRPRKGESPEDEMRPLDKIDAQVWALQSRAGVGMGPTSRNVSSTRRGMKVRRSTDFVNTTAYQFLRHSDGSGGTGKSTNSFSEELDKQQGIAGSLDEGAPDSEDQSQDDSE